MDDPARQIELIDWLTPLVPAAIFVLGMSLVREPERRHLNAIFSTGFAALYVNGGFGLWEFAYMLPATALSYLGLRSYRYIGAAWLLHTGWDVAHHFWGMPLWHGSPMSSWGCAVMDAAVSIWFFAGAPSIWDALRGARPSPGTA